MSTIPTDVRSLSRRRVLQLGAAGAAAGTLGPYAVGQDSGAAGTPRRVARVAYLSDIHLQPELEAEAGAAACLHHAQSLDDPADLIVTGGDSVMDVFEVDQSRTDLLGGIWQKLLKSECSLPVRSMIGNHDIRPWVASDPVGESAKKWAAELLGIDRRYYAFDHAGWRFFVLDSVQPNGGGYAGYLDPEQRVWLETELAELAGARPVVIASHIPILSVTPLLAGNGRPVDGDHAIAGAVLMRDSVSLHRLLRQHSNVKLCLSGHLHLLDRIEVDGVTYICAGAVSGNWWKGRRDTLDEGYGVIDLYDDGSFDFSYQTYDWHAAAS